MNLYGVLIPGRSAVEITIRGVRAQLTMPEAKRIEVHSPRKPNTAESRNPSSVGSRKG